MSTDVKSMHMGQITSFFIPTVTLVGQNLSLIHIFSMP